MKSVIALQSGARAIDRANALIGRSVSWLTLAMVLIYCLVVILRYAFDYGSIAMQESVTYLHAAVFMLAASWTLRENGHVRVDIFYSRWDSRARARVNLFGALLFLLPMAVFLFAVSWDYVSQAWGRGETSAESGGLPFVYLLKTLLLVMPAQLAAQALAQALEALRDLSDDRVN